MSELTSTQRKQLRSLAHHLDPVAKIGKGGLTDQVVAAVRKALEDHELIKVKFVDFKDQKKVISPELAERAEADLVGLIGNIALLYRESTDEEKKHKIVLR